jgi:pimeloyl-ACP methyl ester carboxylesterase
VVTYSRLGFGRSAKRLAPYTPRFMHEEAQDTLPPLRRALGIERPLLVGHSTGASIGLLHAAHDSDSVSGVVAMAPLVDVQDANLGSIRAARRLYETTDWRSKLARHHDHPVDEVFASWNDTWLDPAFRSWSIVADLARVRCPVLAIVGVDDPHSSPQQLDLIAAHAVHAPCVELMKLPSCGHTPHREQPAAVIEAIARLAGAR